MGFGIGSFVKNAVGSLFGSSGASGASGASALGGLGGLGYSALLSSVETGINTLSNSYASRQQWKYDKKLMDYQNQYNLPVNQRARLEEAGYNPNLALNGVNVQSASASAPQVKPALVDMLGAYNLEQQNRLLGKQVDLTDENINNARVLGLLNGRKANIAYYNDKYAQAEYEIFKKTGKIPMSYYRATWDSELVGLLKGLITRVFGG